jgi:hypothetical protein
MVSPASDVEIVIVFAQNSDRTTSESMTSGRSSRRARSARTRACSRSASKSDVKAASEGAPLGAALLMLASRQADVGRAILVDALRLATYSAAPLPRGFVPPCLPTKAPQPPSGDTGCAGTPPAYDC